MSFRLPKPLRRDLPLPERPATYSPLPPWATMPVMTDLDDLLEQAARSGGGYVGAHRADDLDLLDLPI